MHTSAYAYTTETDQDGRAIAGVRQKIFSSVAMVTEKGPFCFNSPCDGSCAARVLSVAIARQERCRDHEKVGRALRERRPLEGSTSRSGRARRSGDGLGRRALVMRQGDVY